MSETITIDIEFEPYPGSGSGGGIPVPPAFPPSLNLLNGIATQEGALQALGLRAGNTLGAIFGNPTGGYLGAGTINLDTGVYINGVPVSGGGIAIPTATLLSGNGSALGGIAVDGTSVGVTANTLSVNTGTSGAKIPFLSGANTWGAAQVFAGTTHTTLAASGAATFTAAGTGLAVTNNATVGGTLGVTGTASAAGLTQVGASALFRYTVGATGNYHAFVDGSGNILLEMGAGAISPKFPIQFNSTVTLSGATYVVSANAQLQTNTTVSGSPTFTTLQYALNSFQLTDNLTPTGGGSVGSVATISTALQGTANTTRNLYTIDSTCNITVTPGATNVEAHAGRYTAQATAASGGTNSTTGAACNLIGLKSNATLSAAATYYNIAVAHEIQLSNLAVSGAAARQYGCYIQSSSTVQGALDDAGLAIFGGPGFVGYKTALLFGSAGSGNTMPTGTLGTGTLIGTANLGTNWTATTGIDFTKATFTGNTFQDGHTSLAGNGSIGFNGATPQAKGNITGSKTSGAAFISLLAFLVSRGDVTDSTTT